MHAHFSSCTSGVFDFSFHNSSRRVEKYRTTLRNINYINFSFCYRRNLPSDDDAFLLYGCYYLDFLFCNPIWSTSNRPSSKTQNNSNKAFKTQASNIIKPTYTFRTTTKKCYYTNTFVILHATIWCKYISIHNEM